MDRLSIWMVLHMVVLIPSCGFSQKPVITDIEEIFQDIKQIEIQGGPLEVSYEGDQNATEVFLNAYLESFGKNTYKISYHREGDKLLVKWEKENNMGGWGNNRSKGFISLTGPENMSLDIKSGSGSLFAKNVDHDQIKLSAGSGVVEAENVRVREAFLTAGSGKINGKNISGNVSCKISSGVAALENVEGNVKATASSGGLYLKKINGLVNATVSSGYIEMEDILELGRLTASSGRIKVKQAGLGPNTHLVCSSGQISVQTHQDLDDFNFNLTASSGHLQVGKQSKAKHLQVDNGAEITVKGSVSSGSLSITE